MYDPEAFSLYRTSPGLAACPLGERLSDAQERVIAAMELIGSRHAGETVAAVTHAVMIRLVIVYLSGSAGETWRRPVGLGSVTEIRIADGDIHLRTLPAGDGSSGNGGTTR